MYSTRQLIDSLTSHLSLYNSDSANSSSNPIPNPNPRLSIIKWFSSLSVHQRQAHLTTVDVKFTQILLQKLKSNGNCIFIVLPDIPHQSSLEQRTCSGTSSSSSLPSLCFRKLNGSERLIRESTRLFSSKEDKIMAGYLIFMTCMILALANSCTETLCDATNYSAKAVPVHKNDIDKLQFAENLEHLEADFFLFGAFGYGLDKFAPELVMGGPPPTGAQKANLDSFVKSIIVEFAYEEVGHLRVLNRTVGGFPRPLMNLSAVNFAKVFDDAFGHPLVPPFDPYRHSLNYMLASYVIPYVGLVAYVGTNPHINGYRSKRVLAGLLGVEAGQDAVIRTYLYGRANEMVDPYNKTVAEFTRRLSELRNKLGNSGIKDEGITVTRQLGAENKTWTNVLVGNSDSISYYRNPAEILRIVYGTGDQHVPGGFFPNGANGKIAKSFLKRTP